MFQTEANICGFECRLIFCTNIGFYYDIFHRRLKNLTFLSLEISQVGLTKIDINFFKLSQLTSNLSQIKVNICDVAFRLIFGHNIWFSLILAPRTEKSTFLLANISQIGHTKIAVKFFKLNQLTSKLF